MNGIDQDKLDGLRELIKLLLALTRAERPRANYSPLVSPPPPEPATPPRGEVAISLVRAAEIVERGHAHAHEAIRTGTEEARAALLQLAEQRDTEQQAVEQVIEAVTALKGLQHKHRHPQGEAEPSSHPHTQPPSPSAHAPGHATGGGPASTSGAHQAGVRRKR